MASFLKSLAKGFDKCLPVIPTVRTTEKRFIKRNHLKFRCTKII